MQDSIFTKIIKGEIPAQKIYEDDKVIAILDINPFTPGHTLVVPRQQIDLLWDIDDPLYLHTMSVSKLVAKRLQEILKPKRVSMAVMGFDVPHAHVHLIPLHKGFIQTTIDFANRPDQKPDFNALAEMAKKLHFE